MTKTASKKPKSEVAKSGPSERTLMLAEVVRENLFAFVVREGMKALDVLLEMDREVLCGPAYAMGGPMHPSAGAAPQQLRNATPWCEGRAFSCAIGTTSSTGASTRWQRPAALGC